MQRELRRIRVAVVCVYLGYRTGLTGNERLQQILRLPLEVIEVGPFGKSTSR